MMVEADALEMENGFGKLFVLERVRCYDWGSLDLADLKRDAKSEIGVR
jgi:hypothetical protein